MRTTGIRLIANVSQYLRELRRSGQATDSLGRNLDKARMAGVRMNNDIANTSKATHQQLNQMVQNVQRLDAEIRKTQQSISGLAQQFARTKDVDILGDLNAQRKKLKDLMNVRDLLPDPRLIHASGEKAASIWSSGFGQKFQMRLVTAAIPAMVALTPFLSSVIAGAVVGAAGLGGVVGGIILASRDERVKAAGSELGNYILGDLERRATRFVGPTLGAIARIRLAWQDMGPDLDKIFGASRWVETLTDGGLKGGQALVHGIAVAVQEGDPVMEALRNLFSQTGIVLGQFFESMAKHADVGAVALNDLSMAVTYLVQSFTGFLEIGAAIYEATGFMDTFIDRARYWIEDNGFTDAMGEQRAALDLTADGFQRGSVEAEAYRKATIGTATAADFMILKHAGMTDAAIGSADASGTYRAELLKLNPALIESIETTTDLKALQSNVTLAQKAVTLATKEYKATLESMGPAGGAAMDLMNGLQTAAKNLYGAQMMAVDSNIAYEESLDSLSDSVKENGNSLTIRTKAGRENTVAFANLLKASNEMYYADIALGMSTDEARTKHDNRTKAVIRESEKLKLGKARTKELIDTYGQIPPKKETNLVQTGLAKIASAMQELYVAQRALADGITVAEARKQALAKNSGPVFKGHSEGGWTGPGSKMQPAGIVHADEYVIKKSSRQRIERQSPGLLDEMNATGQLPGHAKGGLVAPVEKRNYPFPVNLAVTELMTKSEALSKVTPAFSAGNWPGSPGSQRGDSGIWRRIKAMLTGWKLGGAFGNGYRPGDPKWHGSGRAVDWMGYNLDAMATRLAGMGPLELIHRTNKRDYAYTRGVNKGSFSESLMNAHRNHVHIAMNNGGVIPEPVFGMGASGRTYSFAENGPEVVLPNGANMGGSGTTVHVSPTIVINGGNASADQIADRVNRKVGSMVDLHVRSVG